MSVRTHVIDFVLILLGLTFVTTGCGLLSLDKSSGLEQLIQRNRANWDERGIQNYQFTYDHRIGNEETEEINVVVSGGQIDSVSVAGERVENDGTFLTIDRLYEHIVRDFERDDRGSLQVRFNEEYSYPERYRMIAGSETMGRGVVVSQFQILGP